MRFNWKKIILTLACISVVLAMACCFATESTGAAGFVEQLTNSQTGITGDRLWTTLTPFVGLFVTIFIFAFAYGRIKKSTKSGSKGKFNM